MSWARVHRWLAVGLAVPLIVWSITGLVFHLKPGWGRAYDLLSIERGEVDLSAVVAPATLGTGKLDRLELVPTVLGPLYRVTTSAGTELYDAATGKPRSPLTADDARALAADAVAHSPHRAGYGDVLGADTADDAITVRFEHAAVTVGRRDAAISQRGGDTDRIDWLYRIHYLQWTGNRVVDRVLALVGLVLIWAAMIPGLVLFVRRLLRK